MLCTYLYVLGFEKRAHFTQNYNFRYGLKQSCMHIIIQAIQISIQKRISQQWKQLQTQNKVQ